MGRARCRHFRVASTSTLAAPYGGPDLNRVATARPHTHQFYLRSAISAHHSASQKFIRGRPSGAFLRDKKRSVPEAFVKRFPTQPSAPRARAMATPAAAPPAPLASWGTCSFTVDTTIDADYLGTLVPIIPLRTTGEAPLRHHGVPEVVR